MPRAEQVLAENSLFQLRLFSADEKPGPQSILAGPSKSVAVPLPVAPHTERENALFKAYCFDEHMIIFAKRWMKFCWQQSDQGWRIQLDRLPVALEGKHHCSRTLLGDIFGDDKELIARPCDGRQFQVVAKLA